MSIPWEFSRKNLVAILVCLIGSLFMPLVERSLARASVQAGLSPNVVIAKTDLSVLDAAHVGTTASGTMVSLPASIHGFQVRTEFVSDNDGNDDRRRVLLYKPSGVNTNCSQRRCWQAPLVLAMEGSHTTNLQRADYSHLLITSWRRNPNGGNDKVGVTDANYQIAPITENGKNGIQITFKLNDNSGPTTVKILPE